jgi:Ca-activated chloride channel family protein
MKTMMTTILLTALLSMGSVLAQKKMLTGRVIFAYDNSPVEKVSVKNNDSGISTITDKNGDFSLEVEYGNTILFKKKGFENFELVVGNQTHVNILLEKEKGTVTDGKKEETILNGVVRRVDDGKHTHADQRRLSAPVFMETAPSGGYGNVALNQDFNTNFNTEEYDHFQDNIFKTPASAPLSTFSIDVDAASYSNLRRFLLQYGQKPPKDAVRIEEMVNYFTYNYEQPKGEHPFSIITEVAAAPWNENHKLVHIGLQGIKPDYESMQPSNLVFLVDVSGSMSDPNKLPLLISSFKLMVNELRPDDRVAIVVYAGAAGLVLPSTPAKDKQTIISALERLTAGGSTAGGAGIALAYKVAQENFLEGGNNRVILATDGDFNIGTSSTSELVRMIEEKRKSGIYLTIAGFGMGNYKDGRMEQISNAGNGNYFYIDNLSEAKKVFVTELRATLFTIAKDVKIQVEFNPDIVAAYRLIGYENRILNSEDFNDDKKDAGELGAGHTVTALYEIIPVGVESEFIKDVDPLKYQNNNSPVTTSGKELLTVKFRYKKPDEDVSRLIVKTLRDEERSWEKASEDFRWSASVAGFGMLMRDSEFKGKSSYGQVLTIANGAKGVDTEGYRAEFIQMVKSLELIARR